MYWAFLEVGKQGPLSWVCCWLVDPFISHDCIIFWVQSKIFSDMTIKYFECLTLLLSAKQGCCLALSKGLLSAKQANWPWWQFSSPWTCQLVFLWELLVLPLLSGQVHRQTVFLRLVWSVHHWLYAKIRIWFYMNFIQVCLKQIEKEFSSENTKPSQAISWQNQQQSHLINKTRNAW